MMPTFPSSSLKFRTAGFPQYGFKAGVSDRAFPFGAWPSRRAVCRRPSCSPLASSDSPFCAGERGAPAHRRASSVCRSTPGALAPVRVLLSRSITAYSAPSAPLVGTSRLRRLAAYTRCLRCASPPRRPASGSVLSLRVPARHAVLSDRGESIGCVRSVPSPMTLAFAQSQGARHSRGSRHPLLTGECFSRLHWFAVATACRVACLPGGSDRAFHPANGDFYSQAFDGSVTLSVVRYDYGGN